MAAAAATFAMLTVLIYGPETVPEKTLARAERLAGEILARAGVSLSWRKALAEDAMPSPAQIPLHLLTARPPLLHPDAEGFAVLRHDATAANYAGISYPAVVETARLHNWDTPALLGAALAHEIGHVLLNSPAHSPSGVMSARLGPAEIAAAERGELHFTPAQAARIRAEALRRNH
jgi:hypothetical protein